jgi:hypothetical protein
MPRSADGNALAKAQLSYAAPDASRAASWRRGAREAEMRATYPPDLAETTGRHALADMLQGLGRRLYPTMAQEFYRMRASLPASTSILAISLLALGLFATPAFADDDGDSWARFTLGLDGDYAYAFDDQTITSGGGGALRVGSELDLILITLIPEAYFSYHAWSEADASVTTGKLGARVRIGKILEPGVYGHFGIASASPGIGPSYTSPAFDLGFTLDFTLIPFVDIGAHAAYNAVFETSDRDALHYALFGLHVALVI